MKRRSHCLVDGAIADALGTVDDALLANPEETWFRPETYRVRAELRLQQGDSRLAEADFREAIALAQQMKAKAWDLRATMSLARAIRWTSDSLIGELLPAEIRRDSSGSRGSAIRSVSNSRADSCVQYSAALLCHRVVGSWVHGSIALKCSQRT